MFKKIQYVYLLKKYKKWGVLRIAVCSSYILDAGFLKVKLRYVDSLEKIVEDISAYWRPEYNFYILIFFFKCLLYFNLCLKDWDISWLGFSDNSDGVITGKLQRKQRVVQLTRKEAVHHNN
jgi:hypothetical protein